MTRRRKWIIGTLVVVGLAAVAAANLLFQRSTATEVTTEVIAARDLEAIVTASGTIQPKRSVDISAETMGKVVELAVVEGQTVAAGQHLLQIDPRNLETQVQNREASLASARTMPAGVSNTRRVPDSSSWLVKNSARSIAMVAAAMTPGPHVEGQPSPSMNRMPACASGEADSHSTAAVMSSCPRGARTSAE